MGTSDAIEPAGNWLRVTRLAAAWAGVAMLYLVMFGAATAEPRRVLLVRSFGHNFLPFSDFAERFRTNLTKQTQEPIDFYDISIDAARYEHSNANEAAFIDYLHALFAGHKLDLIVTIGAPAARFFLHHRPLLFPSTPLIVSSVDQRVIDAVSMTANDVAVANKLDLAAIIDNILQLLPNTTTVAVVLGNSALEKYWAEELHREFQRFNDRVAFIWFNNLSFDAMRQRAVALPPKSVIFYVLFLEDANGISHEDYHVLTALHDSANAPIVSFTDAYFGRGIVGGPLTSHETLSQRAAEVALRIFAGEMPGNIKTPPVELGTPMFDARELRRSE
jgi:ABC-type uncharacterized transport system substrate-binding protein